MYCKSIGNANMCYCHFNIISVKIYCRFVFYWLNKMYVYILYIYDTVKYYYIESFIVIFILLWTLICNVLIISIIILLSKC